MVLTSCSHCHEPATLKCAGCKKHFYCTKEHQQADWNKHKGFCKDVRLEASLTVAASVVQQAWLTLKETTWPIPISRVQLEGQTVVAYEGGTATNAPYSNLTDDLFPNQAAKHALLCFGSLYMPLALMQLLMTLLIESRAVEIHEVEVKLKRALRTIALVGRNNKRDTNWPYHDLMLLRVTSKRTGKRWYINLSGAEYGLTQAIFTAAKFDSVHLQRLCQVFNFGKCREFTQACGRIQRSTSYYTRIDLNASWRMRTALSGFLQKPGNDLTSFATKNVADSIAWEQSLMKVLTQAVRGYVSNYDPRELLLAMHHETDQTISDGIIQETINHEILVDVRTAEERANNHPPEADKALDMAQLRGQLQGPEFDLVLKAYQPSQCMQDVHMA